MSPAQKAQKRIQIINILVDGLGEKLTPYARRKSERYIAETVNQHFLEQLTKFYALKLSQSTAEAKANSALKWESNKDTTIKQPPFFGTRHQPDFTIEIEKTALPSKACCQRSQHQRRDWSKPPLFPVFRFRHLAPGRQIFTMGHPTCIRSKTGKQFIRDLWQHHNIK